MDTNTFSNKKWKAMLNYGGGKIYVFADTIEDASKEVLVQYRKRCTAMNFTSAKDLIKSIEFVD